MEKMTFFKSQSISIPHQFQCGFSGVSPVKEITEIL
jgi:hypothetical protein